ncbi:MAG: peptidoglycan bridge formation glycyltransferase FemA/FemB family protein [Candidatus Beckwithbacteria bacterium]
MIIREVVLNDKARFNQVAGHPLQTYEWGEFRELTGIKVIRKGVFEGQKLVMPMQLTIHRVPKLGWTLGYFPKGPMPDEVQLEALKQIGKENNCVYIKLEPNISAAVKKDQIQSSAWIQIEEFLLKRGCQKGRPLFTKYTFSLDLTPAEADLLAKMHSKTRYNLRLAEKKGVKVKLDNSAASFELFLKLLFDETIKRQGFYSHTPDYFKKMWQQLRPVGMVQLLRAEFEGKTLSAFLCFVFNKKIYYPYGASTRELKELMAPNLLMWEVIKLGKSLNCTELDMWGALGPNPNKNDPWYGFHRFKQGYGATLMEFVGSYDLVLQPGQYRILRILEEARWKWLKARTGAVRVKTGLSQTIDNLARAFESK